MSPIRPPAPWSDAAIRLCPLGRWQGDPKHCRWCNTPLVGRQRRWCSTCGQPGQGYGAHHDWQVARLVALRRDNWTCRRCGWREGQADALWAWWAAHDPETAALRTRLRQGFDANTAAALSAARKPYDRQQHQRRLEVNHITPCLGRHSQAGCWHHPDGLETLCHPCHVATTAKQFGHRTAAPDRQLALDLAGPA